MNSYKEELLALACIFGTFGTAVALAILFRWVTGWTTLWTFLQ
jgi:hypothetical protein